MITSAQCLTRYGQPEKESSMTVWNVPEYLSMGMIPKRIYCNRDLVAPLTKAFENIIVRKLQSQIKTWDGCFNIRKKKAGRTPSLHSWGLAIDINAAWNGFGKMPTMSKELVKCFTDAGLEWGGNWATPDGMHFQLAEFPQ